MGLDKVVWKAAMDMEAGTVTFSYLGRDGEEVGGWWGRWLEGIISSLIDTPFILWNNEIVSQ